MCEWLGFTSQFSYVLSLALSYEVILHLLCLVVSQIRGSQPFLRCTGSRYYTITLKIAYIVFPLVMSIALSVPPYFDGVYGIAGPWCWVQSLNEDCKPTGLVTQMIFFSMNVAVVIAEIAGSLVFLVLYYKIAPFSTNARFLLKRTLHVMLFQVVHMLLLIYGYSLRLYTLLTHRHQNYGLWVTDALIGPLVTLVFPLGYWLFFYPVKSTVLKSMHKITKCCKRKLSRSGWQVETLNATKVATAPRSNRLTQPSYTYFSVSHPDNFTETSPAMISDSAGYDSINMVTESLT